MLHNADACIGCQYCTWNCQYGVPQYNDERGVVGKCDMCHGRLSVGLEPACVNACPSAAIQVELVNIAEWRGNSSKPDAPGMPPAHVSISTTRITAPDAIIHRADTSRVRREHAHYPLIVMTVLMQLAVGLIAASLFLNEAKWIASAAFAVLHVALAASTLHLGRPIHAIRALRMWKRSWLSREVLLFTLFAGASSVYVGALWVGSDLAIGAGVAAAVLGVAGTIASSCIYLVPARPAWNMIHTPVSFLLTAAILGSFCSGQFVIGIIASLAQVVNEVTKYLRLSLSTEREKAVSALLLSDRLFVLRLALLLIPTPFTALVAEFLGRYLFFVTVVPRTVATTTSPQRRPHEHQAAPRPRQPEREVLVRRGSRVRLHGVAEDPREMGPTTCGYCSVGCGMLVGVGMDGRSPSAAIRIIRSIAACSARRVCPSIT